MLAADIFGNCVIDRSWHPGCSPFMQIDCALAIVWRLLLFGSIERATECYSAAEGTRPSFGVDRESRAPESLGPVLQLPDARQQILSRNISPID